MTTRLILDIVCTVLFAANVAVYMNDPNAIFNGAVAAFMLYGVIAQNKYK